MNTIKCLTKLYALTILLATVLIAGVSHADAAKTKKNSMKPTQTKLWQQINENSLQTNKQRTDKQRAGLPEKYLLFRLNKNSLKNRLEELPLENTSDASETSVEMEIPLADGTVERFRMEETPVLSAELAAQFPTWKTFVGYGIDNPRAIGRFDWNAFGFHGYIEGGGKGTVLIDPYQKGDTDNYLVFYKHEYGKSDDEFSCKVNDQMSSIVETKFKSNFLPSAPEFAFGSTVRTYRLAVATTGEWARNAAGANGTDSQNIRNFALAVVLTTVNRLNGIYERELASRFVLNNPPTNDNDRNIIFDDPATDPYNNTSDPSQLTINQTTITNRRGVGNFDIGHLYGTGGGGVARAASLCRDAQKAEGYSARGTNTGDPFVVDYVAHEIGHQFGGDHTYNNSDPSGACTTRAAEEAFEVASGSTILSYVGICDARNLQQYVDTGIPSFHISSLTVINANLTDPNGVVQTSGCGTASTSTNSVPTVSAGAAFTIPRLTPFTLTATGNDADGGDVSNLLYSWEEYDLAPSASGAAGTPPGTYDVDTDGVLRPLFRAYSPVSGNSRTFPSLAFILNPANNEPAGSNQPFLTYTGTHPTGAPGAVCETGETCVVGERLPTVNRTMNFRVSVRDRRGGVVDAGTTVTVAAAAGPFQVTTQNAPATLRGNSTETVMWDVAGTTGNGINAGFVNILFSTDGGQTFPITLAANTPNDGTQAITVPNNSTQTGRIKIEAVGNIFFDINNANLQITLGTTAATVTVSGRVTSTLGRGIANALVTSTDQTGVTRTAKTNSFGYYRFDNAEAGHTYVFSVSHKRYQTSTRVASLVEDLNEFNFTIDNYSR